MNTYIDGTATFPPEIWAGPDIDSKRTINGYESSNPTSTSTIGEQEATGIYLNTYEKKLLKRIRSFLL